MIEIENNCVGCEYCINCGRKHEEVHKCETCGCYLEDTDNHYSEDGINEYCDDCWYDAIEYGESLTVDNMKDYGSNYADSININGFLKSMYSEDEIETLLWNDFCAMPKEKQTECINEWVKEDEDSWIEYFGLENNLNG